MNKHLLRDAAHKHRNMILTPYDALLDIENGFDAICLFSELFSGHTTYVPAIKTIF